MTNPLSTSTGNCVEISDVSNVPRKIYLVSVLSSKYIGVGANLAGLASAKPLIDELIMKILYAFLAS